MKKFVFYFYINDIYEVIIARDYAHALKHINNLNRLKDKPFTHVTNTTTRHKLVELWEEQCALKSNKRFIITKIAELKLRLSDEYLRPNLREQLEKELEEFQRKLVNSDYIISDENNKNEDKDYIIVNDVKKYYFLVEAKCGHVGRNYYILKKFPVRAVDGKTAAEIIRWTPRVKHHHKDAIRSCIKVTFKEYITWININRLDPYFASNNIQDWQRKNPPDKIYEEVED